MRTIIITIATLLFIVAVVLQFICTMHYVSLLCFGQSALLFMLVKDNPRTNQTEKCNGTCEHCVCKNSKDEQHNQT